MRMKIFTFLVAFFLSTPSAQAAEVEKVKLQTKIVTATSIQDLNACLSFGWREMRWAHGCNQTVGPRTIKFVGIDDENVKMKMWYSRDYAKRAHVETGTKMRPGIYCESFFDIESLNSQIDQGNLRGGVAILENKPCGYASKDMLQSPIIDTLVTYDRTASSGSTLQKHLYNGREFWTLSE